MSKDEARSRHTSARASGSCLDTDAAAAASSGGQAVTRLRLRSESPPARGGSTPSTSEVMPQLGGHAAPKSLTEIPTLCPRNLYVSHAQWSILTPTNTSGTNDKPSAGDPIRPKCSVIEVHVSELRQLFNAIDPSPFRDKDLDPKAEEFIVGWAKDLPRDATLALVTDLDREAGLPDEATVLRDAIHEFLNQRAPAYRQRLRELFRLRRTSLAIGLVALASAIALGDFLAALMKGSRIGEIVRESLMIGGWVSMWRPLEIFLYDWWPIRNEALLSDRLAAMPVHIRYLKATSPDAWRRDWPAVRPRGDRTTRGAQPRALNHAS
jgi:hypothetical protein